MSYCVNCGVELAPSEKSCPLCNTEVINPKCPWKEPEDLLFPKEIEQLPPLSRRSTAAFVSILLLIPIFVTLICNLIGSGQISWSLYVVGAVLLTFVTLLVPMFFHRYRMWIFVPIDYVATFGYLCLINMLTGGAWAFSLALPLCIASCGFTLLFIALLRSKKTTTVLSRLAIGFFALGVFVVLIELILREYVGTSFVLDWSYYVLIPCAVLSLAFLFIDSRKNLKEALKRRIFIR